MDCCSVTLSEFLAVYFLGVHVDTMGHNIAICIRITFVLFAVTFRVSRSFINTLLTCLCTSLCLQFLLLLHALFLLLLLPLLPYGTVGCSSCPKCHLVAHGGARRLGGRFWARGIL